MIVSHLKNALFRLWCVYLYALYIVCMHTISSISNLTYSVAICLLYGMRYYLFKHVAYALLMVICTLGLLSARTRERYSVGGSAGGTSLVGVTYLHATGANYNNALAYHVGLWNANELSASQQSIRYFGDLYLRPFVGAGLTERLVNFNTGSSLLLGIHGLGGIEYSFADRLFIGAEVVLHLVLYNITLRGDGSEMGHPYFGRQLIPFPGLYVRYAF